MFEKRMQEISKRIAEIRSLLQSEDTDVNVDELETEYRELEKEFKDLEKRKALAAGINIPEFGDDSQQRGQANPPAPAPQGKFNPIATYGVEQTQQRSVDEEQVEYRKAFKNFVLRGTPIPVELRDDEHTLTTDVASVIPTVLVNKIIENLESIGMILPLITRTSYAAGVQIPTSSVKPVATWVSEGAGSDTQKKTTSYISFSHFKLRCEISMSMEVGVMALSAFEAAFVRQVSEAMVKKIEATILSDADGTSSPKGIFAETPATGQALTAKTLAYKTMLDAEAALPQAYEGGAVWCMTKKTFMAFVGIEDAEGQPIARVNYGITGKPERTLLGRQVVLCGDYMDSFSPTLTAGKIFACLFNFSDYVLNTIYDMGIQRKQDWDTEGLLTKAVMSVDGKVVDKGSLVTIAKSA